MALTTADKVELIELAGRYGDAIDDRNWAVLDTIFTEDAVFDVPSVDARMNGLDDIKHYMAEHEHLHPGAHLMTNIYSLETAEGAEVRFRGVLPTPKPEKSGFGLVLHGSYYDQVVRTDAGWRVKSRVFLRERRDKVVNDES